LIRHKNYFLSTFFSLFNNSQQYFSSMFKNNDFDLLSSSSTTSNIKKTNIEEKLLNDLSLKSIELSLALLFYSKKSISRKISILLLLFTLLNNAIKRQFIDERSFSRKKLFKIDRTKAIARKISILFFVKNKRKHKRHNMLIT